MTTAGREALIEAMRLEQARIYGQLQPEHTNLSTPVDMPVVTRARVIRLAPPREDVA